MPSIQIALCALKHTQKGTFSPFGYEMVTIFGANIYFYKFASRKGQGSVRMRGQRNARFHLWSEVRDSTSVRNFAPLIQHEILRAVEYVEVLFRKMFPQSVPRLNRL